MLRRITVAYGVNELGNWLGEVALAVAVFDHTRSAVAVAAYFVSVRFLPAVAVTAVVTWLESLGARKLIPWLYAVQAVTTGGLALLLLAPSLAPILVLSALDGLAAMAVRALLRASISERSVDDVERRHAMGRLNSAWSVTFAIGPAAGGVLTAALGPSAVLLLDVASFAVTAGLMIDVPAPSAGATREGIAERLRAVGRHVRSDAMLGWLLGIQSVAMVFFSAVVPVEIILVKVTLGGGDSGYGALLAAWGVGTVAGSALFARARSRPLGGLLTMSTCAVAVGYLGIAAASTLWVACAFSVLGGIGNGAQWIAVISSVQEKTPAALQSRLMGVIEAMGALCPAIGFALGGAIAAISSPRVTFVVAGAAASVTTLAFALLAVRSRGQRPIAAAAGADGHSL